MRGGRIEQSGTPMQVFEHPANEFVLDFLGNVNKFQVSVQNGMAQLGSMAMPYPDYPHAESRDAAVYVRSHELRIDRFSTGASSLEARVVHITPAGSVMKVRLKADEFGLVLNVDIAATEFAELKLVAGDQVYVSPRRVRLVVPDYSI
jgi:sulfate transport system ATP-binding protein